MPFKSARTEDDQSITRVRGAYIRLAEKVLRHAREPLSASEIIARARTNGWMPTHLYGKTQYKTLNARISEHIRLRRDSALIFRVGPARYFLTEFLSDPAIPPQFKKRYRGILRSKQVRQERVLVANAARLRTDGISGFVPFDHVWFSRELRNQFKFVDRRNAESRNDIKQFVSYAIVVRGQSILSYRRGSFNTASEALKGARSVGFGGHISETDFDLFSFDFSGVIRNASRELYEELFIGDIDVVDGMPTNNLHVIGLLNLDDTPDAQKHVAVVMLYFAGEHFDLRKGELSINELSWLESGRRLNDLSEFELWSEVLLRKIFDRTILLDELK